MNSRPLQTDGNGQVAVVEQFPGAVGMLYAVDHLHQGLYDSHHGQVEAGIADADLEVTPVALEAGEIAQAAQGEKTLKIGRPPSSTRPCSRPS